MNIIPAKYQSDVAQACIILVAKEAKIIMADNLDQFSKVNVSIFAQFNSFIILVY